jgi:hypothetical protein
MKLRSLILATVVLVALVGTLYWSNHHQPAEDSKKADDSPSILKLDEASIVKVEIKKQGEDPVVLSKTNSGSWQITAPIAYRADQSNVSSTLSSLSTLNSQRVVEEKASDLKQFGLAPPSVEVNVTEKDNKTQNLLLGDDTPNGSAVYALLGGDPRVFTVASYNRNTIAKALNDFRDKRLLPVSADQISRLDVIRKGQTIEFGRNKEEWQILQPKPLRADSTQVAELVEKLTDAKMNLGIDLKQSASAFASGTPVVTAKVTSPSGTQELQIRKNKDDYYGKSSAVDGIYKINLDVAHALDKDLDGFRNKKVFDVGFADPNKVEVHNGSKSYFLTRNGSDWWLNGKKLDVDTVGALLSGIRDVTADKLQDSGSVNPSIDVTVTWDEGKRVEKASFEKQADAYLAKRENEVGFYHLQAAQVDAVLKAADDLKPAATPSK